MAIISMIKRLLRLDSARRDTGGTAVPVEREPATDSEQAVKGPGSGPGGSDPTDVAAGRADEPVDAISGIGPAYAERLGEAGIRTVGDLAGADAAAVAEATGLGEGRVAGWIEAAKAA